MIIIGIIVALIAIGTIIPFEPELRQKTEVLIDIEAGGVEPYIFMLADFNLGEKYFYDDEHSPIIQVEIEIANEEALITWHIVKISKSEIQELIVSGEGFTKYIVKNGASRNKVSGEATVTEGGDYVFVFLQSNDFIGPQPHDSKVSVTYWVFE